MGGCCGVALKEDLGYYNFQGRLVKHKYGVKHSADDEFTFVNGNDRSGFQAGDECYLIQSKWLHSWLRYSSEKADPNPPQEILNSSLLDESGFTTMAGILPKINYRPVTRQVWEYLFEVYGGGPVIAFIVPTGLEQSSYASGAWIKQVKVHEIAVIAYPVHVDELKKGGQIAAKAALQKKVEDTSNPLVTNAQLLAVNAFNKNTSASKMNEDSKALGLEADLATQKGVALLFQSKDAGFEEAVFLNDQSKLINESANLSSLMGAAALFKDNDSEGKKYQEEALLLNAQSQAAEKEAAEASGDMAAQYLLSNLSNSLQNEAKEVKNESTTAQKEEVAALFMSAGSTNRMAAAMKEEGDSQAKKNAMELAAARMVQSAWRSRKARQRRRELEEKRKELIREAFARKLQMAYRVRLAKKKMAVLKAEAYRLRQEAVTKAALAIQCAWRRKTAKRRMREAMLLRQEARRLKLLAMNKAASAIQGSWRRKLARRQMWKAAELRKESKRLRDEACAKAALSIQCAWRVHKARANRDEWRAKRSSGRVIWDRWRKASLAKRARAAYLALLEATPHILEVHLQRARGLMVADMTTSDPYVLLHGERNPHSTHSGASSRGSSSSSNESPTICVHHSKVVYKSLNPDWDERVQLPGVSCRDRLVLTLMDKDTFSSDDNLGQVVLSLSAYPQLVRGSEVRLEKEPVRALSCSLHDVKGKEVSVCRSPVGNVAKKDSEESRGTISLTFRLAPLHRAHSGWVSKKAHNMMGSLLSKQSPSFKPRLLLLSADGVLTYFEDAFSLEKPRGTVNCRDITAIHFGFTQEASESKVVLLLEVKMKGGDDDWVFQWTSDHFLKNNGQSSALPTCIDDCIAVWVRKIQYAAPKGVFVNDFSSGTFVQRIQQISSPKPLAFEEKNKKSNNWTFSKK